MENIRQLVIFIGLSSILIQASIADEPLAIVTTDVSIGGKCNISGSVHANNCCVSSSGSTISGSVSECNSVGARTNRRDIRGSIQSRSSISNMKGAKPIDNPPVFTNWPSLPIDYYRSIAQTNNRYYVGNTVWTKENLETLAPGGVVPGGVIYVEDGSFIFMANEASITACVVAENGIRWNLGDLVAPDGFPAMVVTKPESNRLGVIDITGSSKIKGLLYSVNGSISIKGKIEILGQLFSKNGIRLSGASEITYSNCVDSLITGDISP